tara:strand:+ start:2794 stop:2910 length:117 start_codon:yes stop_codon:yes gene_type:complete
VKASKKLPISVLGVNQQGIYKNKNPILYEAISMVEQEL